jgi:hypothetical protein
VPKKQFLINYQFPPRGPDAQQLTIEKSAVPSFVYWLCILKPLFSSKPAFNAQKTGCGKLISRALASVKRRARPAQYAIYHLHVLEELPVESVCRVLGVNSAQVYLAKHRVGSLIKKELLRLSKASS